MAIKRTTDIFLLKYDDNNPTAKKNDKELYFSFAKYPKTLPNETKATTYKKYLFWNTVGNLLNFILYK